MPSDPKPGTSIPPAGASPVWEMVRIATPTVVTMLSYTLMQFIDGLMVARIDPPNPVNLAAAGNGGVWAFVPTSILVGVMGVVNTFVSQNLGAGRPERGSAYAWNALWLAVAAWVVVLVPFALALPWVFAALHAGQEDLIRLESDYGRILLLGGVLTIANRGVSQYFYGMHRPLVPLVAAVCGNLANLAGNWVLIYGNLGAPALGVHGAAIATVVGSAVELMIPMVVFVSAKYDRAYHTRSTWRPSVKHMRELLAMGWAPAMMFGNELVCWAIFMTKFQGRFGEAQTAAGWIALRYMHLAFMPAVGLGFACTAVVGRCLGAGQPEEARRRAWVGLALATGYMGACALAFIVFREPMVRLFIDDGMDPAKAAEILRFGASIMIVAAFFQVFDAMGISLIGVLRGAGDTVWPGVVTVLLSWVFLIGAGAAISYGRPEWGAMGPWIAAGAYIIALGLAVGWRFLDGSWMKRRVVEVPAQGHP